jgi:ribosomal protein L20A (L18A)
MPEWNVEGSYLARRGYWQVFRKRLEAASAEAAQERALSQLGGSHGVGRHLVKIESVTEAPQ